MGNCVCVTNKTTTSCSGDDWGLFSKRRRTRRSTVFHDDDDGEKLLGETNNVMSSSSPPSCGKREIKIKMTRKEFEDLMRDIDMKGLTVEEILSKLVFDGGDQIGFAADLSNHHQQPWRPALQSIPEID
ncbi:unnamed protein product [Microthlaspi erraticum]|uniref:Uncharacterized protein n=1 Tax=Microthlaspi erraticum TaxID=1685480 RepID=A0A6D2K9V3_9BRAS|nr:unnamed protein product [Microthlaspi erraticum]